MKLALLLAGLALPMMASAATLKPYTSLDGGVVHLSDLFEGADNRAIGPAPPPGGRITVEAQQLSAIARMFKVDWRSSGPGDRAILEREGRSLGKDDVMEPLRAALELAGAPAGGDIVLPSFTTPMLPTGAPPSIDFTGMSYDAQSGRFTTTLVAAAEGVPPVEARLSGRVQEMAELPAPRRAMAPGEVIGAEDLQMVRVPAVLARGEIVLLPVQAEGLALRRPATAGRPIRLADLGRPVVVEKGATLALRLDGPGLQVTAQGIAAESGGVGERIRVLNPYSRAVIEAEVTGPGQARVLPGTRPVSGSRVALRGVGR